jgi:hypothetical protein
VTFTWGVATQLLRSAHRLTLVITRAKLFQIIFSSLKVMELTRNVDFIMKRRLLTFDL